MSLLDGFAQFYQSYPMQVVTFQMFIGAMALVAALVIAVLAWYRSTFKIDFIKRKLKRNGTTVIQSIAKVESDSLGVKYWHVYGIRRRYAVERDHYINNTSNGRGWFECYEHEDGSITPCFDTVDPKMGLYAVNNQDRVFRIHELKKADSERRNPMDKYLMPITWCITLIVITAIFAYFLNTQGQVIAASNEVAAKKIEAENQATQAIVESLKMVYKEKYAVQTFEQTPTKPGGAK